MADIITANKSHLAALIPLFDGYRVFYGQASDRKKAAAFLEERLENCDSLIFLAIKNDITVGFTQLYPSFSSVSLQPVYILNDLYVSPSHRNHGIGALLLSHAQAHCRKLGFKGLSLETAVDNPAQRLYEKLGWVRDSHCFHYFWLAS